MAPVRRHLFRCRKQPQIIQNLFHEKHVQYTARRHYAPISGLVSNLDLDLDPGAVVYGATLQRHRRPA